MSVPEGDFHDDRDEYDPQTDVERRVKQIEQEKRGEDELRRMLERRREAYVRTFNGAAMDGDLNIVIEDLRKFCRGGTTTFHNDARIHALLTGRQEVYLRIHNHVNATLDELIEEYTTLKGD